MPWPDDALSDNETIVTSFRPHWKLLFIPFLWFLAAMLLLGLAIAWDWINGTFLWLIVLAVVFAALWLVVRPLVNWYTTRYVLTSERLITRTGLVAKSGVEIPLERITNVNFSQSVFERMLGAGDLLIESAGSTGQSEFSNIPRPDQFQTTLYMAREQRTIVLGGSGPTTGEFKPHASDSAADSIERIADLRDKGLISEEEYEQKRKKLLDEI
jgi:membrane protein YdbS with pleckstrin-like domain